MLVVLATLWIHRVLLRSRAAMLGSAPSPRVVHTTAMATAEGYHVSSIDPFPIASPSAFSDIIEQAQSIIDRLRIEHNDLEESNQAMHLSAHHLHTEIDSLQSHRDGLRLSVVALTRRRIDLSNSTFKLNLLLNHRQAAVDARQIVLDGLRIEGSVTEQLLQERQDRLELLRIQAELVQTQLSNDTTALTITRRDLATARNDLQTVSCDLAVTQSCLAEETSKLDSTTSALQHATQCIARASKELQAIRSDVERDAAAISKERLASYGLLQSFQADLAATASKLKAVHPTSDGLVPHGKLRLAYMEDGWVDKVTTSRSRLDNVYYDIGYAQIELFRHLLLSPDALGPKQSACSGLQVDSSNTLGKWWLSFDRSGQS
jgi:peptidoglycan hydrolase CwlO-like protein